MTIANSAATKKPLRRTREKAIGKRALDTIVSAWKVEGRAPPPAAAAAVDAFAALLALRGQIEFDDLVVGAVAALDGNAALRERWQSRFTHVCVDEFQGVDAAQLRLVRILAAPEDNLVCGW